MGLKILHSADWHLDAPFSSFSPERRALLIQAQRRIPDRIARLCREEKCDLVLLSGDLFDGDSTRETARILYRALERMDVPVFISPGNHDFYTPDSPWSKELWPDNVHIFTGDMEYIDLPRLNCRVYGAGYRSMDCPPLLDNFRAEGDGYRIGILHADPTRANSPYCPVTAAQAAASNLHYLALGHIHKSGSFHAGSTLVGWPGCPMGRGWDETGEKGLYIVTLEESASIRSIPLDTMRFTEESVDIGMDALQALQKILPPTPCDDFFRITLTGSGDVDLNTLRSTLEHLPNLELLNHTEPPTDLWEDAGEDSLRGVYFRMLQEALFSADGPEEQRILLAAEISKRLLEGREVILP